MPTKVNKTIIKEKETAKNITVPAQIKQAVNWELIVRSLKTPHVTEKATIKEEQSKYIFRVPVRANKVMIKQAFAQLYGKKVVKIGIINIGRKKKQKGRKVGFKPGYKKAVISLRKGEKITLFSKK